MLATIQIAEIENGFIVIAPPQHHQNLVGAGMYPASGKYYPTLDALVAEAPTIIAVAIDAAREGEKAQRNAMSQRLAQRDLALGDGVEGEFNRTQYQY